MQAFWSNWFPNIVCTVVGIGLSLAIGYFMGMRHAGMMQMQTHRMETLLQQKQDQGMVELEKDSQGNVTGFRVLKPSNARIPAR